MVVVVDDDGYGYGYGYGDDVVLLILLLLLLPDYGSSQVDMSISYFKNGTFLGVAFSHLRERNLYPSVGMRTEREHIAANFSGPFVTDIAAYVAEARKSVLDSIRQVRGG